MDSGISSAGNGLLRDGHLSGSSSSPPHSGRSAGSTNFTSATTPTTTTTTTTALQNGHHNPGVETRAEVHPPPPGPALADHRALDELLNDMLLTVENIPDLKPSRRPELEDLDLDSLNMDFGFPKPQEMTRSSSYSVTSTTVRSGGFPKTPTYLTNGYDSPVTASATRKLDFDDSDIPYHARQDSRPFTYGVVPGSPVLQRKRFPETTSENSISQKKQFKETSLDSPTPQRKQFQQIAPDSPTPKRKQFQLTTPDGPILQRKQFQQTAPDSPIPQRKQFQPVAPDSPVPQRKQFQQQQPGSPSVSRRDSKETLQAQPGLASPSLVRKASTNLAGSSAVTSAVTSPTSAVPPPRAPHQSSPATSPSRITPERTSPTRMSAGSISYPQPVSYSTTPTDSYNSPYFASQLDDFQDGSGDHNLTWLQRQQQKLRERRELQLRAERHPQESRLMVELRNVQHRLLRPREEDGYASDTTLLSDFGGTSRESSPGKYGNYATPLHINTTTTTTSGYSSHSPRPDALLNYSSSSSAKVTTPSSGKGGSAPSSPLLPHRTSSRERTVRYNQYLSSQRPLGRQRSDTSFDRERPFVAVKRAHEQARKYGDNDTQFKNESFSSWRTASTSDDPGSPRSGSPRPQTPAFPVHPRTPYVNQQEGSLAGLPPKSPTTIRKDRSPSPVTVQQLRTGFMSQSDGSPAPTPNTPTSPNGQSSPTVYYGQSRRSSIHSNSEPQEVSPAHVKFVRDTSRFWYKPTISREQGSLSALVYQHSLTPMALPCQLLLPECEPTRDVVDGGNSVSTAQMLLAQGAACNVLYLFTMDTESLTGPEAVKKSVAQLFLMRPLPHATIVHFKVSGQGITLTDNERKLFFRRHYPVNTISYCGLDPDDHRWSQKNEEGIPFSSNRCFGFVARKPASKTDNQCHIFAELEPEQPASAIANFVSKVMMTGSTNKANIV